MNSQRAAQEKPTSPRTEAGRTLVQRMLSSKTDDRMGPDDLQRAILAIEREAAAATPSPMTDDEYLADAARREAREAAWPQLHHDRAAAATPSLDALHKEAWKFLDHITQQDYVGERVNIDVPALDHFRSVLARLDEGSATPPRIREVVGRGDGTMIVTLDDGTERRITEQEYLDWPRDEGSATPDQGKGEPR